MWKTTGPQRTLRDLERELLEERRLRNHCEAEASRWRAEAERLTVQLAAKRPRAPGSRTPSTMSLSSPDATPDTAAAPEATKDESDDEDEHDVLAHVRRSAAEALVVACDSQRIEGPKEEEEEEEEEEDVVALANSFRCFSVVELEVCI